MSARSTRPRRRWGPRAVLALAFLSGVPAAPDDELVVTGQVLYGRAEGATAAASVDVHQVYASNPAYMRMSALGLSPTEAGQGKRLFEEAQTAANAALARVARDFDVDVITMPGGASGGRQPIPELTQAVIEQLPVYHVDGQVLMGNARTARLLVELDSGKLLKSIPAYRKWLKLKPTDAEYHFLRQEAQEAFESALMAAARDNAADAVAERGAVTSRLGPVTDITRAAIDALSR